MRRSLIAIAVFTALATSIPYAAQSDETLVHGGQPLIYGKVERISSHSVVVLTRDGETLPIEFDSRTVMSTLMPAGSRVRVEFRLLDSGRYLAQRITPLDPTSEGWAAALTMRHSARNRTRVAPAVYAGVGSSTSEAPAAEAATSDGSDATASTDGSESDADASVASTQSDVPSSGPGPLPLILVIGVLALAGSIVARRVRGRAR